MLESVVGRGSAVTTEGATSTGNTEARLEQIHDQLAEMRTRTQQLEGRAQSADATPAEIRATTCVGCQHGEEVQLLTAALTKVEHELEGLRVAMETRAIIEQAKGMLMLREGCDADTAFSMLVDLSQHGHRKLVDVARMIVTTWSARDPAQP